VLFRSQWFLWATFRAHITSSSRRLFQKSCETPSKTRDPLSMAVPELFFSRPWFVTRSEKCGTSRTTKTAQNLFLVLTRIFFCILTFFRFLFIFKFILPFMMFCLRTLNGGSYFLIGKNGTVITLGIFKGALARPLVSCCSYELSLQRLSVG